MRAITQTHTQRRERDRQTDTGILIQDTAKPTFGTGCRTVVRNFQEAEGKLELIHRGAFRVARGIERGDFRLFSLAKYKLRVDTHGHSK